MKKAIALALLAAILVSTFSCGGENQVGNDTSVPSGGDTTSAAKETSIYDELPQSDLNGMEITIFGYGAAGYNYVDSEAFEAEQTGEPIEDAIYQRNIDTENRLGVKLVWEHSFDQFEALNTYNQSILAGDNICDIFVTKAIFGGQVITSGTVMPWNDVQGIDLEKPWYVADANEQIKLGKSQYGILSDACSTNTTMCWTGCSTNVL